MGPRILVNSRLASSLKSGDTSALTYNGQGSTLVGGLLRFVPDSNGSGTLYKLLLGAENKRYLIDQDVLTGPLFPDSRGAPEDRPLVLRPQAHTRVCGRVPLVAGNGNSTGTCLFNLNDNEAEEASGDLALVLPELFDDMLATVDTLQAAAYSPDRGSTDPAACTQALGGYGGYWGPWLDL